MQTEVVQDPRVELAQDHRVGDTRVCRLQHQHHRHGLLQDWRAYLEDALHVVLCTRGVTDTPHDRKRVRQDNSEECSSSCHS